MLAPLLSRLRNLLAGTLRRQLVVGVALVNAVLMAGFVWDLTARQRNLMIEHQIEHAQALAGSLATTSAGWVAARDLAGLREIVEAQRSYPGLVFIMILDRHGRVLAHSDPDRLGRHVLDLPATAQATLLASSPTLVDAAAPVLLAGRHVGWARAGLAQDAAAAKLAAVIRDGILYALAAILLGSTMAWFMGRWLTRRLAVIQGVADAVERGDLAKRAALGGTDEAARLAGSFDRMLDGLAASHAALADSEQRLLLAFDAASMVAWRWDIETDKTIWGDSSQVERLLGPRPPEGYADFVDMVVAEDRDAFIAAGRAALAGDGEYVAEFRLRSTDGRVRWVLARGRVIRAGDGHALAILGVSQDITERKRAEQQLRKLSLAVEQSPNCIVITDLDGRIEYVNAACARISGYAAEELLGQNPRIQQSGKTPPETYVAMWAALSGGRMWKGELINRKKDGSEYTELTIITPLRQPDGRVMHYVAVKQDITEQKRLAEELERHRDHLEERVAERTVDLIAARAEAERLARAKSEFLANMSHELRTPLNGVLGMARIGVRDSAGRSSHETFVRIQDSGAHLLGVINDILDFSKLDAGKLVVEQHPFALAGAIDNAASFVAGVAREKGLSLEVTMAPDLPAWVVGDAQRLRQILVNLLSNAIKFTARGEVRLRVAAEDGDIWFKVIDSGIGLSEEQAARLFRPFEQADSSTTRRYGGTGLGLAISQNLARLMGGEITVDCALGAGCSFMLRLPLPEAQPHLPAHVVDPAAPTERRLAGLRLLAAEDVEVNRLVLEDLLSHE
ncbi:MAG: PAS domain S-box protein, partial [Rhodocyclaceae bacterium]|nr:PAS domain S-box protein [Rhodocyclaceae bacterium]